MEVILIFLIFCLSKRHKQGFSNYEQEGWNQVFFLNENKGAELFIDGYPAGLSSTGVLYFPPESQAIHIQYFRGDEVVMDTHLSLHQEKTFFMAKWVHNRLLRVK